MGKGCPLLSQRESARTVHKCINERERWVLVHSKLKRGTLANCGWKVGGWRQRMRLVYTFSSVNEPSFKWHSSVHWATLRSNIFTSHQLYTTSYLYSNETRKYAMSILPSTMHLHRLQSTGRRVAFCVWTFGNILDIYWCTIKFISLSSSQDLTLRFYTTCLRFFKKWCKH